MLGKNQRRTYNWDVLRGILTAQALILLLNGADFNTER